MRYHESDPRTKGESRRATSDTTPRGYTENRDILNHAYFRIGLPPPRLGHSRSGAVWGSCGYNEDAIFMVALSDTKDDLRIIVVASVDNER